MKEKSNQLVVVLILVAVFAAVAYFLFIKGKPTVQEHEPVAKPVVPDPVVSSSNPDIGIAADPVPDTSNVGDSEDESAPSSEQVSSVEDENASLLSSNELQELLPGWMDYEGVDLRAETISVAGHSINRARGRFEWPNGSLMEMEVSDLGNTPDIKLLKSLGFNVDAEPEPSELDLLLPDMEATVARREYDAETMEGSVQLLVQNRFLVEIQLENLPPESFRTIIDFQVPLLALIEAAQQQ